MDSVQRSCIAVLQAVVLFSCVGHPVCEWYPVQLAGTPTAQS